MLITYKDINKIHFPVYKINDNYHRVGKKLLTERGRVIDNKDIKGATLGVRRLWIPREEKAVLNVFIPDFFKLMRSNVRLFIDNYGDIHKYQKTKTCNIKVHKIVKVEDKDGYYLIHLQGIPFPFLHKARIPAYSSRVEVAYIDSFPWIIYDFLYDENKKRSYIRI